MPSVTLSSFTVSWPKVENFTPVSRRVKSALRCSSCLAGEKTTEQVDWLWSGDPGRNLACLQSKLSPTRNIWCLRNRETPQIEDSLKP